ncbi:MAG: hypothetical protein AB8A66_02375, partial [Prochlorococcus sp.]
REPPITSDPLVLLEQPELTGSTLNLEEETSLRSGNTLPLPPDLPPPLLLREGETLPIDLAVNTQAGPSNQNLSGPNSLPLIGAPPPPVLPPPPLSISDAELIN